MIEARYAFTAHGVTPAPEHFHTEAEWKMLLDWPAARARGESTANHLGTVLEAEARAMRAAGRAPRARAVASPDGRLSLEAAWRKHNAGKLPAALANGL